MPDCKKFDRGFCMPDMGCLDPEVSRKVHKNTTAMMNSVLNHDLRCLH